jgi:translation initiation factor 1 (eIF-1/SUI1)
MICTVQGL